MGIPLLSLGGVFLQGFTLYALLGQWENAGVFDLILPFLLIFAVIFGILSSTRILGGHKGVNLVISLVIGLMALRLGFVQVFFTELFPRFGVGLAAIIVVVILAALFIPQEHAKGWFIGFAIAGAVIGVLVLIFTFNATTPWFGSYFWQDYWGLIIGGVILVVLIIAIFVASAPRKPTKDEVTFVPFRKNLDEK